MSDPITIEVKKASDLRDVAVAGVTVEELLDELLDLGHIDQEDREAMLDYYKRGGK